MKLRTRKYAHWTYRTQLAKMSVEHNADFITEFFFFFNINVASPAACKAGRCLLARRSIIFEVTSWQRMEARRWTTAESARLLQCTTENETRLFRNYTRRSLLVVQYLRSYIQPTDGSFATTAVQVRGPIVGSPSRFPLWFMPCFWIAYRLHIFLPSSVRWICDSARAVS